MTERRIHPRDHAGVLCQIEDATYSTLRHHGPGLDSSHAASAAAPVLACDLCGKAEREPARSLCQSCGELIVRLLRYPAAAPAEAEPQPTPEKPTRFGRIRPGLLRMRDLNSTPGHVENEPF